MIGLAVTCAACGEAATHSVGAILLDLDAAAEADDAEGWTRAVYVPMSITCPRCAAVDEHRVVPESGRALVVDDQTVMGGRAALSDGTPIHTPSEGIALLRARAEAAPGDARTWRALGNFAVRAGRSEEAMEAYHRGAAIEGELHCALVVATDAVAREVDAAPELVARAVERVTSGVPRFRPLQAAQLAELLRKLGVRAPAFIIDDAAVDPRHVRDWQRLGEQLAIAKTIRRSGA